MLKQFFEKLLKIKPIAQPAPAPAPAPVPEPAPAPVTVTVDARIEPPKAEPIQISLTSDTITFPENTSEVKVTAPAPAHKKANKGRPKTPAVIKPTGAKGPRKKK